MRTTEASGLHTIFLSYVHPNAETMYVGNPCIQGDRVHCQRRRVTAGKLDSGCLDATPLSESRETLKDTLLETVSYTLLERLQAAMVTWRRLGGDLAENVKCRYSIWENRALGRCPAE